MLIVYQHERQVAKEETETMRQKLDEGLDNIRSLLNFRVSGLFCYSSVLAVFCHCNGSVDKILYQFISSS